MYCTMYILHVHCMLCIVIIWSLTRLYYEVVVTQTICVKSHDLEIPAVTVSLPFVI